jgi:hypothetical protein
MSRRVKIRLAGCAIALLLLAAFPAAIPVLHTRSRLIMTLYWIVCGCLLTSLLGVALLDLLETVRIVKHTRIKIIRDTMLPPDRHDIG